MCAAVGMLSSAVNEGKRESLNGGGDGLEDGEISDDGEGSSAAALMSLKAAVPDSKILLAGATQRPFSARFGAKMDNHESESSGDKLSEALKKERAKDGTAVWKPAVNGIDGNEGNLEEGRVTGGKKEHLMNSETMSGSECGGYSQQTSLKRELHTPSLLRRDLKRQCVRGESFRLAGRLVRPCRFFREGYCREGDNCAFSHGAKESGRLPELCKYYRKGICKKGAECPLLHGEFPCKAFHKGRCSKGDTCRYSHIPLDEYTRSLFEKFVKEEKLRFTARAEHLSSNGASKNECCHRTLLPDPVKRSPGVFPAVVAHQDNTGKSAAPPPPSLVMLSVQPDSTAPMPDAQSTITSTEHALQLPPPAFFEHHRVPFTKSFCSPPFHASDSVQQLHSPSLLPDQGDAVNVTDQEDEAEFDITVMLDQIAPMVPENTDDHTDCFDIAEYIENSFRNLNAVNASPKKNDSEVSWKMIPVDDIPLPNSNTNLLVPQDSSMPSLLQDPRVKKALNTQSDWTYRLYDNENSTPDYQKKEKSSTVSLTQQETSSFSGQVFEDQSFCEEKVEFQTISGQEGLANPNDVSLTPCAHEKPTANGSLMQMEVQHDHQ